MVFKIGFAIACLFASSMTLAGTLQLSKDGKSDYVIVVADDAIAPEQFAAKEFQDGFKEVTGATLPIMKESDLAGGDAPRILIGRTRFAKQSLADVQWDSLGHDGIVMKALGTNLILAGGRPRGAIYAVNTFLEDVVGVRWWTSDESSIPHKPTLEVAAPNSVYVPKLVYRESFNYDAEDDHALFSARLKLNGHFAQIPEDKGGHYNILGWCHTSFDLIPPGKYFAQHPEWFAQINGKRQAGTQLCLSNPQMKAELIRRVLARVRRHPEAGIISVSQNDTFGPCQCDECRKIVAEEGSESGPWIRLVNDVAAAVDKEYPEFLVETLAYQYTRTPPKVTKPSDHVLVRLCSIECDFSHPLDGPSNVGFANDLRGWSSIARNLFVWNYVTNFGNYLIPQPNMTSLDADLRFFVGHHVVGVFEQGDVFNKKAGDMLPLRLWLLAHLMWNPDQDQTKLRDEFLNGYYGAAGPFLGKYVDLINAVSKNSDFRDGCGGGDISYLTPEAIDRAAALFDGAAKAVAGDATLTSRVRRERLVLDHVKLMRYDFNAAMKAHPGDSGAAMADYRQAASAWSADAKALGVTHISEGQGFDSYVPALIARGDQFIPPKLPAAGAKLTPDQFDIQQNQFSLFGGSQLSSLVADGKASDGHAARMVGNRSDWAIQFHIPAGAKYAGKGPWRCYLLLRCDVKHKFGSAFRYGLFGQAQGGYVATGAADMSQAGDGEYHAYGITVPRLFAGEYFWIAGVGENASAIYLDRIFIEKDAAKTNP